MKEIPVVSRDPYCQLSAHRESQPHHRELPGVGRSFQGIVHWLLRDAKVAPLQHGKYHANLCVGYYFRLHRRYS